MTRKLPLLLEPSKDLKIAIFGGGNLATHKCEQFQGFYIRVVAEEVLPEARALSDEVVLKRFKADETGEYMDDAFMVVAATDSKALNTSLIEFAKSKGILTNSIHGGGDVILPATVRKKTYSVSVSSEGAAPAFTKYLADAIDTMLGPEYDLMVPLIEDTREIVKSRISPQSRRAECLREIIADGTVWDLLRKDDYDSARDAALRIIDRYL